MLTVSLDRHCFVAHDTYILASVIHRAMPPRGDDQANGMSWRRSEATVAIQFIVFPGLPRSLWSLAMTVTMAFITAILYQCLSLDFGIVINVANKIRILSIMIFFDKCVIRCFQGLIPANNLILYFFR